MKLSLQLGTSMSRADIGALEHDRAGLMLRALAQSHPAVRAFLSQLEGSVSGGPTGPAGSVRQFLRDLEEGEYDYLEEGA